MGETSSGLLIQEGLGTHILLCSCHKRKICQSHWP